MSKYIVTVTHRYEVEAISPNQALGSYRVGFDDIEPKVVGLRPDQVIRADLFEYIDGQAVAEESN